MGIFVRWLQRFVQLGLELAARLIGGLLSAPVTAAKRATAPITVRQGTATELIDVRHQVLRRGRPRSTAVFDGDDEPSARHWVAVQADRVVGVVTVLERPLPADTPDAPSPPPRWQLRGMAVLEALQGEGVGGKLLSAVHTDVAEPMWCNARTSAQRFYDRHGWKPLGEPFPIEPIGPHQRMMWTP